MGKVDWFDVFFWSGMAIIGLIFVFAIGSFIFTETHACTKWTEPYYHPGYFISSGKTSFYQPGGVWSDCVGYGPKK